MLKATVQVIQVNEKILTSTFLEKQIVSILNCFIVLLQRNIVLVIINLCIKVLLLSSR